MFKRKNNLRRNVKYKEHKNNKKTSSYVEDYNEVILNDLVDNNKTNNEYNVQEDPIRKKKKSINFNLGTKKKSTSNDDKNQKRKNLNKKHKNDSDGAKENIDVENNKDIPKVDAQPKNNKSSTKSKKVEKESKKSSKKKSKDQPIKENTKKSKKKTTKKSNNVSKENKGKKITKKPRKEDEVNTKSVESIEIEQLNNQEDVAEGNAFRNMKEDKEFIDENSKVGVKEEEINEYKFNDIIWSDDNFPKN